MINIGSLRKNAKKEKGLHIRCDRASPLGNPFPANMGREKCIQAFADNWDKLMLNPKAKSYFAFIKKQSAKRDIVLMCWCAPLPCHCDIIKSKIESA